MTVIRHEIDAPCTPDRVWTLLADLEAVERYNPGVREARIRGTPRTGIGAMRVCELLPSGRVTERVTHWEEGRALGLEVAASDWPIQFMRWVTRVEPRGGGGTRITQELEYRVKFGPVGWLLDRFMMERKLRASLDTIFASLVKHASGAPPDPAA
jgi:hypothetical protein